MDLEVVIGSGIVAYFIVREVGFRMRFLEARKIAAMSLSKDSNCSYELALRFLTYSISRREKWVLIRRYEETNRKRR